MFKGEEEESEEEQRITEDLRHEQQMEVIEHVSSYRASEAEKKEEEEGSMVKRLAEKDVKITLGTYGRYIGSNPANYLLFPITVIFFVAS